MRAATFLLAVLVLLSLPLPAHAEDGESAPYLGIRAQRMTGLLADALGLEEEAGVLLSAVAEGSPAADAGLRRGEVLLAWNGEPVRSSRELIRRVRGAAPGETVRLTVAGRKGERTVSVVLGEGEKKVRKRGWGDRKKREHRRRSGARLGVKIHDLNEGLAPYFDLSAGEGALVLHAEEDGPAAEAGVRAGDVIVRLGEETIGGAADLRRAIAEHEPGDEAELVVLRKGEKKAIRVALGARRSFYSSFPEIRLPRPDWTRFRGMDKRMERELDRLRREMERLREKIEAIDD